MSGFEKLVCMGGVAGSGKSTLIMFLLLKWAKNELWSDSSNEEQHYDFVFNIVCREINSVNDCNSLELLLKKQFPEVFDIITFADLLNISDHVLIIIDGIDEFISLEDVNKLCEGASQVSPIAKSLYEAINPLEPSLMGHSVLISGRPEAIVLIQNLFNKSIEVKAIEVLGFNPTNVDLYISKYFADSPELYKLVTSKVSQSTNLTVMGSLPVFLSIISDMFESESDISPDTTTELFSWALGLYLRNHFRDKHFRGLENLNLKGLFRRKEVRETLDIVIEIAYRMLSEGTVVFDAHLFPNQLEESLEYCGLITKINIGEFDVKYQFRHLSLQEFCAAAHILKCDISRTEILINPRLRGCIPMLCGLENASVAKAKSPPIIKSFVNALCPKLQHKPPLLSSLATELFDVKNQPHVLTGEVCSLWEYFLYPTITMRF